MVNGSGDTKVLKTVIDSSVLNELGRMYTSVSETFREFVQNSFDALSQNVEIVVDFPNDVIIIKDDGVGMNDYVVENHYINVGLSTKKKDIKNLPPIPDGLDSTRKKIGRKGMGKLSWILLAGSMETITTTIDNDNAITVKFESSDLETNEIGITEKTFRHGTLIKLTNLKFSELYKSDVDDFIKSVGFLSSEFKDFNLTFTLIQYSEEDYNVKDLKVKKVLAAGYELRGSGVFKDDDGTDYSYNYVFRLPNRQSKEIAEFWLLSNFMAVKELITFEGFSGYLNIDDIELVANRNDVQSDSQDVYHSIMARVENEIIDEIELMILSEDKSKYNYIDVNKVDLCSVIYNSSWSVRNSKIVKYMMFDFYNVGKRKLIEFLDEENVIYYYDDSTKNMADRASYYGYKCFMVNTFPEKYCVVRTFDSSFVQSINDLPKEAYQNAGTTIKPVGVLSDTLDNMKVIFESLNAAYDALIERREKLEKELRERADMLTEDEIRDREKEIEAIRKQMEMMKENVDEGRDEEGEEWHEELKLKEGNEIKKKHYKKEKEKPFKQNLEHYIVMEFAGEKKYVGFAFLEKEEVIANIYMYKYIHLNLNNQYIKDIQKEEDPLKQLILLTPHICHEVTHLWSDTHNEVFQSVFNSLLNKTLSELLKRV